MVSFICAALIIASSSSVEASSSAELSRRFVPLSQRPVSSALPEPVFEAINRAKRANMNWRGVPMLKSPFDACVLIELLRDLRPKTVIELGALAGGSAWFIADQLEAMRIAPCHVYSLDVTIERLHPDALRAQLTQNLSFVPADVRSLEAVFTPEFFGQLARPLLVLEDAHVGVRGTLDFFDAHLRAGDYVVVEDTVDPEKAAVLAEFVAAQPAGRYAVDARLCDYFGTNVCSNPNAYLRRMV